jgi:nitroreductase
MKNANPDHPIHDLLAARWSPYGFAQGEVSDSDLLSLFEAARWAPSSYNEQPWSFVVARRGASSAFERALDCLMEANQAWARHASALVFAFVSTNLARGGKPNGMAQHDLGLAVANLTFEATARGLHVHQMGGIFPDKVRELFAVPAGHEPLTALAVGTAAELDTLDGALKERDGAARTRKGLAEFVFAERWGEAAF